MLLVVDVGHVIEFYAEFSRSGASARVTREVSVLLAELVLWIGWLQWQIRSFGNQSVAEPVVHDYRNIDCRDAVLAWDRQEIACDEAGRPLTRWDGVTRKPHPVTGEPVPDEAAQMPQWRYVNPRQAEWPQADFVMCWWRHAADAVCGRATRRTGLITTNSVTMIFNRRVVEAALDSAATIHLAFAIPDHPWVDVADGAAVRIAMTVLSAGATPGRLLTIEDEVVGENGEMTVALLERTGLIHANLKVGAAVASARPLKATQAIISMGVMLAGAGFIIDVPTAGNLRASLLPAVANRLIRSYRNGRDLTDSPRGVAVIDTFGGELDRLRSDAPSAYQHLSDRVKPERDAKRDKAFRERWWLHGRARAEMRTALAGLPRFIATVETAKHRTFQFLDASVLPDHKLIAIALSDAQHLGVLSSMVHITWTLATGGTLEDRPVYNKSVCFETFPFPADDTGLTPALAERIRSLAEQLDAAVLQAYGWADLGPVPWGHATARAVCGTRRQPVRANLAVDRRQTRRRRRSRRPHPVAVRPQGPAAQRGRAAGRQPGGADRTPDRRALHRPRSLEKTPARFAGDTGGAGPGALRARAVARGVSDRWHRHGPFI